MEGSNCKLFKQVLRWQVISILDAFTELVIFGVAISVIWGIQMSASRKARVLMAFMPRLPYVVLLLMCGCVTIR